MRTFFPLLLVSILFSNDQIPGTDQKRPILLRGGILHTVSGEILEEHDLLFAEGKIVTIDEQIQPSPETDIYDIYGKHVVPGFIAGYTRIGLTEISAVKQTNDHSEIGEFNPNVRANVAYNPDSEIIPTTRSNGVLIANVAPGSGLVSGQSSIMMMDGWTWENATIVHTSGLHVNWPNMGIRTRGRFPMSSKRQIEQRKIIST